MAFSATAFICLYNEADIIRWTVKHLIEQGLGVYIIDNWSTDGSGDIAREFSLEGYEKFPADGPSQYYSWTPLLQRVETLTHESKSSWCIHHDADEIRRSPRRGESLLDAFARVDGCRYNAVNFQVYHFRPTDDAYTGDPEKHFQYYTVDHGDCRMRQVKAWKNTGHRVNLSATGGHYAAFPGIAVWPEKFILKHYPWRTSEQAERKILWERLARYDPVERAKDWHVQYNGIAATRNWISDPKGLTRWEDGRILKVPGLGSQKFANQGVKTHQISR